MSTVSKEWIPIAEAARKMECSPRTVQRLAEAGKLRRVEASPRFYLVHIEDVEREAQNQPATGRPRGT